MGYSKKWNQPVGDGTASSSSRPRQSSRMWGFVAGALVVVVLSMLGIGTYLWLLPQANKLPADAPEPSAKLRVTTRSPSRPAMSKPKAHELAIDERKTVTGQVIKVPRNPFGTPIPKDLEYKALWEYTPEDYARVDPGYAERHDRFLKAKEANPWKTPADQSLSMLLFPKGGNMGLLIPFDARFKDKFLKSLETPIIISKDDPEELKEQKRQLIEAKIYLKEKLDEGEDIVAILNEEYRLNKKMHDLRENLRRELRELEKSATSVEEIQEYIDAANIMLEREGAGKIGLPLALTRYRLNKLKANEGEENE